MSLRQLLQTQLQSSQTVICEEMSNLTLDLKARRKVYVTPGQRNIYLSPVHIRINPKAANQSDGKVHPPFSNFFKDSSTAKLHSPFSIWAFLLGFVAALFVHRSINRSFKQIILHVYSSDII